MKNKKTPQEKQSQCDRLNHIIGMEISKLYQRIDMLKRHKMKIHKIELTIDDPHALIPDCYRTIEECLGKYAFPNTWLGYIFKNRYDADRAQLSCNTYQECWHVVPCKPREHYVEMIKQSKTTAQ